MSRQAAKDLTKELRKQGFEIRILKNGHAKVSAPDGRSCQISLSPSDIRGVLNAKARLKRHIGFDPRRK